MAELVNGEARTSAAVLAARMESNEAREAECRQQNHQDHETMFDRLRTLEVALVTLQTRVALWAAVGAFAAGIGVQLLFKLWK